jgi:hypothetical protein
VIGTNYVDLTATNGTTYYYVVSAATAISAVSETANSPAEAGVTPVFGPTPSPMPGYNSPMYAGMTLNLTASTVPGAAYNWTGPNGFTSTNQNPSIVKASTNASGVYNVTATVAGLTSAPGTAAVTVNPRLVFSIQTASGNLILNWPYGMLQSATNLFGPWTNVIGATSPLTNVTAAPQQFYRVLLQ